MRPRFLAPPPPNPIPFSMSFIPFSMALWTVHGVTPDRNGDIGRQHSFTPRRVPPVFKTDITWPSTARYWKLLERKPRDVPPTFSSEQQLMPVALFPFFSWL